MIQIQHLTFVHRKDLRILLSDFSLTINPGDKIVIVGEEGNGKSTLLKWIHDPVSIEDYIESEGQITTQGEKMAYLPQELPLECRPLSIYEFFCGEDSFWDHTPADLYNLTLQLHLPDDVFYSSQIMGTLSGGEKVKLQMARLLMTRPDVLLLDEPSNDIDIETLKWMEDLILGFAGIVLFISHDEKLIEAAANRVVLLEQLRRKTMSRWTVANKPFRQFMEERSASFKKQIQLSLNERREERIALDKIRRIQQKVEQQQTNISRQDPHGGRLLKKKMSALKSIERRYSRDHDQMTEYPEQELAILIRFHGEQSIPPSKTVLDLELPELIRPDGCILSRNISLHIRGPEKVCITGLNGSGKTTLIRVIYKMLNARDDLRVSYMPQEYEDLLDIAQTPVEYLVPSGKKEDIVMVRNYLGSLRFTIDEMNRPIRDLSGGQKAKIILLGMSLTGVNVLLLDEPSRNFSPLSGPEIRALFRSFPGAVISISHDRKFIEEVADKVYYLSPNGLDLLR